MNTLDTLPEYLTHEEACAVLRCAPKTLYKWNSLGTGPARVKRAGRVLYPKAHLIRWIEDQTVDQ